MSSERLPGKWRNKILAYNIQFGDIPTIYFLLFQKASTNILLYLIATGQTVAPSSNAPLKTTKKTLQKKKTR